VRKTVKQENLVDIENPPCKACYILCSADYDTRYKGASGGFVTELTRYLYEKGRIQTSINFQFSHTDELFTPSLIHSFDEYNQVGSIYHEINIVKFVKDNLSEIRGTVLVVCLPCQARGLRVLLKKKGIDCIIVSLICSGQTKIEGTLAFLKYRGLQVKDIHTFRYRGNGWPSGIMIETQEGRTIKDNNIGGDWGSFRKRPYSFSRCISCSDSFGSVADFTVGDPWYKEYKANETTGCNVVGALTFLAVDVIECMLAGSFIHVKEKIDNETLLFSQESSIRGKKVRRENKQLFAFFQKLMSSELYRIISNRNGAGFNKRINKIVDLVIRITLKLKKLARKGIGT
jgi:coenzyme F420-reducing hydrogenase beta subunit